MSLLRIGTRGSKLALWQATHVRERLAAAGLSAELLIIKTSGDKDTESPLSRIGATAGGKGLFAQELEEALLEKRVDLAVHSSKDLPSTLPTGLAIAAYLEREDPRDALLLRSGKGTLESLAKGAKLGTSSLRRMAQLRLVRPDLSYLDLRGNVDTRVKKLEEGRYDAIVLAMAGLKRMGLAAKVSLPIPVETMIPAVGQGAIAVETRAGEPVAEQIRSVLDHPATRAALETERAFLAALGGGCQLPAAAHATVEGERVLLRALIASPESGPGGKPEVVRGEKSGPVSAASRPGKELAEELLSRGGGEILARLPAR